MKLRTRIALAEEVAFAEETPAEGAAVAPDKMLRDPDIEEPAVDVVPPDDMLGTSTNYDDSQGSTAGQKDDFSDNDLELKDGEVSELPKVMMVTDSLEDFADAGEDKTDAAGYELRVPATEADLEGHTNPDASATVKQDHGDGCCGGGDEDSMMTRRKPSGGKTSPTSTMLSNHPASSPQPFSITRVYPRS